MDRAISNSVKQKRKNRRIFKSVSLGFLFVISIIALRFILHPSIKASDFYTDIANTGNIEASVSASGTVIPEFEEVKTSPIQAQIVRIYRNVGDKVVKGDSILALDTESTRSSLEKLTDELCMKKNNVVKHKLQLEKQLTDLKTLYKIKKLQLEDMEEGLKAEQYLHEIGGSTKEKMEKARLNVNISKLELEKTKRNIENLEHSMRADLLGLNYEINIQQKNVNELQNKLNKATVRSARTGVITWIETQIGKNVTPGSELVKIANLESFGVSCRISDLHADKLRIGAKVIIRINSDKEIRGEIVNIYPAVIENIIQFKVKLDEKKHALLRPNLKVDAFVITSFKKNVLRVKNGPFYKGAAKQSVYIVKGNKLIKREIEFGESNMDYVEIKSALSKGERIVISEMEDYSRHQVINIKN